MKKSTAKILVYFVILLTVLNLATIITIGFHVAGTKTDKPAEDVIPDENTTAFTGKYFRDRLQLRPDQMNTFHQVNTNFRTNAREINLELIDQRRQMFLEMQKEIPDTIVLNHFSDSIGKLHQQLKKCSYEYYIRLRSLCNDTQKYELDKIFQEFFINDFVPGGHGNQGNRGNRGNGGPKRYGRQKNQ